VEIETLKKVNAELLATIDECLEIQAEGRQNVGRAEEDSQITGNRIE
jgi:uncharacterized protein YaaN involved in tellurite resistance